MCEFKVFFRMNEETIFESEEEVNEELEKMYSAMDGEFVVIKDGEFYCEGLIDKDTGQDIKKLAKVNKHG